MLVPESEIIKLEMSVADGIKFIISLGAIAPDDAGQTIGLLPPEQAALRPAGIEMNVERTTGVVLRTGH